MSELDENLELATNLAQKLNRDEIQALELQLEARRCEFLDGDWTVKPDRDRIWFEATHLNIPGVREQIIHALSMHNYLVKEKEQSELQLAAAWGFIAGYFNIDPEKVGKWLEDNSDG